MVLPPNERWFGLDIDYEADPPSDFPVDENTMWVRVRHGARFLPTASPPPIPRPEVMW